MKKFVISILTLCLFAFVISGCGNKDIENVDTSTQVTVSVSSEPVTEPVVSVEEVESEASVKEEHEPVIETYYWDFNGEEQELAWDKLESEIPSYMLQGYLDYITIKYEYEVINPDEYYEVLLRKGWNDTDDVINGDIIDRRHEKTDITIKYPAETVAVLSNASFVSAYGTNMILKAVTIKGWVKNDLDKELTVKSANLAVGSHFSLYALSDKVKKITVDDDSILTVENDEVIALKEGTTTLKFVAEDAVCEYNINVFDQSAYLSPDYSKIRKDNYLNVLEDQKKKMNELLNCDFIAFTLDYFNDVEVTFANPQNIDVNLLDMMIGGFDIYGECSYVPAAEWHTRILDTNWEHKPDHLDLSFTGEGIDPFEGEQLMHFSVDEKHADAIRGVGRLWLGGHGFKLKRATIVGTPASEYAGITATADSPVPLNGDLHVDGVNIKNQANVPVRLNGVACGWNRIWLQYGNSKTYAYLRDDWGCKAIRVGFTIVEEDGYCMATGNRDEIYYYVCEQVDACIESGMYAVIDWHTYFNPLDDVEDSKEFFDKISKKYANVPNVIYEICNEPCDNPKTSVKDDKWSNIKEYANQVISTIRNNSPEAIIVCGSPSYSNDLASVINDPLEYENVVYTDHIYEWHYDNQLPLEKKAVESGLALLITETNPSYDDNGVIDAKDDAHYMDFEALWSENNIGIFMHFMANEGGFTALTDTTITRYGWTDENYTEAGKYMRAIYRKAAGLE